MNFISGLTFRLLLPAVDPCGSDLRPFTLRQSGVRHPAADIYPDCSRTGDGANSQSDPWHLQPQPTGEGRITGGDVEHHTTTSYRETDMNSGECGL